MRVVFFNKWHNGDVFLTLGLVRLVAKQLAAPVIYCHPYSRDIDDEVIAHQGLDLVPPEIGNHVRFKVNENNGDLYVNTWVGAYKEEFFPDSQHPDFLIIKQIWKNIFARLGLVFPSRDGDFELLTNANVRCCDQKKARLPEFFNDFSKFDKNVWVCNSHPKSLKINPEVLDFCLGAVAAKYPNVCFFCTRSFAISAPNVKFIDRYFETNVGNVFAFSYLASFFTKFIGMNTGPLTVAGSRRVMSNPSVRFMYLGGNKSDIPFINAQVSADVSHISDMRIDSVIDAFDRLLDAGVELLSHPEPRDVFLGSSILRCLVVNGDKRSCGISEYGKSLSAAMSCLTGISSEAVWVSSDSELMECLSIHSANLILFNHHPSTIPWMNEDLIRQLKRLGYKIAVITGHEHVNMFWSADFQLSADPMYRELGVMPMPLPIFDCSNTEASEPGRRVNPKYDFVIGHSGIINTNKSLLSLIDHFKSVLPDMRILYRYHVSLGDFVPNTEALLESFLEQARSIDADIEVFVGFLPKPALISWLRKNDLVVFSYSKSSRIGSSASVSTCLEAGVPFLVNDSSFFDSVRRKYNRLEEFKAADFEACQREFSALQVFARDQFACGVRRLLYGSL
jgi:hypothetical protein